MNVTRTEAEGILRRALHRWGSKSETNLQVLMHDLDWRSMNKEQLALAAEDAVDRMVGT